MALTLKTLTLPLSIFALSLCAFTGCAKEDEADRFRNALPEQKDITLAVNGTAGSSSAALTGTRAQSLRLQGGQGVPSAGKAQFYTFTRQVADAVDRGTVGILGAVAVVLDHPPTTLESKKAVWGPVQGSSLDPVTYRFTVTEVGDDEYDYVLDGRPRDSQAEADFQAILSGHGWGKDHPDRRRGWFTLSHTAENALEAGRSSDTGTVKITFDARAWPFTIDAEVRPEAAGGTGAAPATDIRVTHDENGAGQVGIDTDTNVEGTATSALEATTVTSKWDTTGAGRAVVRISGGDLESELSIQECWSSSYQRTFYSDNLALSADVGSEAACPFAGAAF